MNLAHRAVVFALFTSLAACSRSTATATADAAPPVHKKIVPPRVIAAGEQAADLAKSSVSFSVIKDHDKTSPVVAKLALRDGAVALGGAPASARLSIDIDSTDTGIPIRNERIRGIFFETSAIGWDTAELVIPSIPPDVVAALKDKKSAPHATLDGTVKIHGHTANVTMVVDAAYAPDGRLVVKTASPAKVAISDFALTDNLHRLSAICMHDSIDDVVTVEASLEFLPQ